MAVCSACRQQKPAQQFSKKLFGYPGIYVWNGDKPAYEYWDRHTISLTADYRYSWTYYMKDKYPGDTQVEDFQWTGVFTVDEDHQIILHVKDQKMRYKLKTIPSFCIATTLSQYSDDHRYLKLEDKIPFRGEFTNGVSLKYNGANPQ